MLKLDRRIAGTSGCNLLRDRDQRGRGQLGASLLETLVALVILMIAGSAITGGLMAGIGSSRTQRGAANLQVAARNAAAGLETLPYIRCGSVAQYQDAVDNSEDAPDPLPTITSVSEWNGTDGSDAAFVAAGGTCPDRGLQRITFTVAGSDGKVRQGDVLKRYDGSTPVPDIVQPVGTTRCTISGTTVTDDAMVAFGTPGTNFGSADTMDLSQNGAQSTAYLRFDLAAGTPCTGAGETGSLPPLNENQVIRNAALRLYTWQVNGGPDCATECTHALQRVSTPWVESTVNWNDAPGTLEGGAIQFSHGSGTGDWGPRYQEVVGPQLVSDVQSFYSTPSANRGWKIVQACAATGFPSTGCTTTPPGFQIRTSEWGTEARAPRTDLVVQPGGLLGPPAPQHRPRPVRSGQGCLDGRHTSGSFSSGDHLPGVRRCRQPGLDL